MYIEFIFKKPMQTTNRAIKTTNMSHIPAKIISNFVYGQAEVNQIAETVKPIVFRSQMCSRIAFIVTHCKINIIISQNFERFERTIFGGVMVGQFSFIALDI